MKKVFIIVMIMFMIVSVFAINTESLCFADEYDETHFYETTKDLTAYSKKEQALIIIPYTYYFKITGANENYYIVSYNNTTLYCLKTDISKNAKVTDLTEVTSPYYTMTLTVPSSQLNVYDESFELASTIPAGKIDSLTFIGYYINNSNYYFFVSYSSGSNTNTNFILASDVITNFSPSNIALHPNSDAAKNKVLLEQTKTAENNLKRNIFFFTICVMCVIVVFLIYKPFKKKGATTTPSTYSGEDDF